MIRMLTTTFQLDKLPTGAIVVDKNGRGWQKEEDHVWWPAEFLTDAAPLRLVYLPGDALMSPWMCRTFGHKWYTPPIITLKNLTYCRRCGATP